MAEIHIERKERTTWPWVLLGLVLLALLLWWLFSRNNGTRVAAYDTASAYVDSAAGMVNPMPNGNASASTVAFLAFNDTVQARGDMGIDHQYTASGIHTLATTLQNMAGNAGGNMNAGADANAANSGQTGGNVPDLQTRVDSMNTLADAMQRESSSLKHANFAHQAFMIAADVMKDLQQSRFPNASNDVQQVRQAANDVEAGTPLLDQRSQIRQFFDRAATAVRAMSNGNA